MVVVIVDWVRGGHPRYTRMDRQAGEGGKGRSRQKRGSTGKIEPITKVEVKSKASGIVKKLLVDYGDTVKKGQLLAELDKEEILAQVEPGKKRPRSGRSQPEAAEAELERAKV